MIGALTEIGLPAGEVITMNRFVLIVVSLALLGVGCSGSVPGDTATEPAPSDAPADPDYTIDGNAVRIDEPGEDGRVSLLASAMGDLNDDGRDDSGVILRLNSKGSGVFYYLNVFLDEGDDGWRFVGEGLLGDRIKFDFLDIYREGSVSSVTHRGTRIEALSGNRRPAPGFGSWAGDVAELRTDHRRSRTVPPESCAGRVSGSESST